MSVALNLDIVRRVHAAMACDDGANLPSDEDFTAELPQIQAAFDREMTEEDVAAAEAVLGGLSEDQFDEICCGEQDDSLPGAISLYLDIIFESADFIP